ncbi:MAG: CBS domain-containing protein [Sedimentisphaerales bacterium]
MYELRPNSLTLDMATSQIEVESRVTELATQAFKTFCDDISGIFGVDMECEQREIVAETVADLQKRFNKLVAVNIVDSEGLLGGTFQFIFDQEGLFTLGGIIVMLPEERIVSNRQNASAELAESMVDAIGEAGNLLVGSWDRIFREGLEGHNHFAHRLPAFVGKPWDKSEETMGLAGDEEVFFIPYEMTVGSYPAFNGGVIFPKIIFGESSDFAPEQTTIVEQDTPGETEENTQDMQTATEKTDSEEPDKESDIVEGNDGEESKQEQPSAEETPADATDAGEIAEQAQTEQVPEDTADSQDATVEEQSNTEESQFRQPDVSPDHEDTAPDPNAANDVAEDTAAAPETSEEPARSKIFEAIRKITQSPAVLPGQSAMAKNEIPGATGDLFEIHANDIMQNKVTWASPDDSLQQAFAKMQQTDAGYIMIGRNGALEGIVSKSDITRAMSPYLLPIFAKWRRPLDDATLKIRIKWMMSRPVRTIKPETSLAAIMEYMSQFRGRCLPVTDEAGNVQGLVTTIDIFQTLLQSNSNTSAAGETDQALVESASPTGTT